MGETYWYLHRWRPDNALFSKWFSHKDKAEKPECSWNSLCNPQGSLCLQNSACFHVNFVKASSTNTKLFAKLCKEIDSAYETLLFHKSVRWLSKGNMLACIYDMREELRLFYKSHRKEDLLMSFTSEKFQLTLAYLVDIFESLNHLNRLLQGKNTNRMDNYDAISAFIAKLALWHRRIEKETQPYSPILTQPWRKGI